MDVVYQMFSLVKHLFFMILSEKVNKSLILDEETDCQGTEKNLKYTEEVRECIYGVEAADSTILKRV